MVQRWSREKTTVTFKNVVNMFPVQFDVFSHSTDLFSGSHYTDLSASWKKNRDKSWCVDLGPRLWLASFPVSEDLLQHAEKSWEWRLGTRLGLGSSRHDIQPTRRDHGRYSSPDRRVCFTYTLPLVGQVYPLICLTRRAEGGEFF